MFDALARGQRFLFVGAIALSALAPFCCAQAKKPFQMLYSFGPSSEGAEPRAPLIRDKTGNLYGTTYGSPGDCNCGSVFKLAPDGTASFLYVFATEQDGFHPAGGLVMDKKGNIYGTTQAGGEFFCGNERCGTVFRIAPDGAKTTLHSFNGTDGNLPLGGLIIDKAGDLYGTTTAGGASNQGTVFELRASGTLTTLHSFNFADGAGPEADLIADQSGNLYGTTVVGGPNNTGTIFKVAPDGTETVLQGFTAGGSRPQAALMLDGAGNLYGTTEWGGRVGCADVGGCGVAFKVAPDGTETVLHAFGGGSDGSTPFSTLVMDKSGNLYGTTSRGGGNACGGDGCGAVFKIDPQGNETVIQVLSKKDGALPTAGLIIDRKGRLYGTTSTRGPSSGSIGTVFQLTP